MLSRSMAVWRRLTIASLVIVIGAAVLAPAASAGTYTVAYSGGQWVGTTGTGTQVTLLYSGTSPYGMSRGGVALMSSTCTGTITATFTFSPSYTGEPPPQQVILYQKCTVSGKTGGIPGDPPTNGTVTVDTGLGQTQSGTNVNLTQESYTAHTGGQSFVITCPASARTINQHVGAASSGVQYTATASPISISIPAAVHDFTGGSNVLIGQGCTSSLAGIPSALLTGATYAWAVSGNTFQKWTVASPSPTSATLAKTPFPLNQATAHWYWSDTTKSQTVSCTAKVTPPAGMGAAFNVGAGLDVNLASPTAASPKVTLGSVQINTNDGFIVGGIVLYLGPTTNTTYLGVQWETGLTNPALFSNETGGGWNVVQIIHVPTDNRTTTAGAVEKAPIQGLTGLDKLYPYMPTDTAMWSNDYSLHKFGDTPGQQVDDNHIQYNITQTFDTYIMYLPPGSDSQWVPFQLSNWGWSATPVNRPSTSWADWPAGTSAGTPTGPSGFSRIQNHPVWQKLVVQSSW